MSSRNVCGWIVAVCPRLSAIAFHFSSIFWVVEIDWLSRIAMLSGPVAGRLHALHDAAASEHAPAQHSVPPLSEQAMLSASAAESMQIALASQRSGLHVGSALHGVSAGMLLSSHTPA